MPIALGKNETISQDLSSQGSSVGLLRVLRVARSSDGKAILRGVRFVEDLTPSDFNARKKAHPLMKKAYDEGKKVRFTRGKLFIDGREIYVA